MARQNRPAGVRSGEVLATSRPRLAPHRQSNALLARYGRPFARVLGAGFFSLLSYGALTSGAIGPETDLSTAIARLPTAPALPASLSFDGGEPILSGSVDHMFEAGSFVGPNRLQKQDRPRVAIDVAAFSAAFESTRKHLASLRVAPQNPNAGLPAPQTQLAAKPATPNLANPRLAVASLAPQSSTSALNAIANAAVPDGAPAPVDASTQLAYARETAPVTSLPATPEAAGKKFSQKELWCLATAIYFEARGEAYRGQVAVAQVVMNRTKHDLYPDTICGVVFQNQHKRNACQFSFACDGHPETVSDKKSWAQAEDIASKVTGGDLYLPEVANATHYHATYVYPDWAPRMNKVTKVGLHVFYRFKRNWQFG